MSFSQLGLSANLVSVTEALGYTDPTPVQKRAIPLILKGLDLIATAQTGTGKTAAYGIPLVQRLANGEGARGKRFRALILVPTRELALQVHDSLQHFSEPLSLSCIAMYGGTDIEQQKQRMVYGADVVVATPGRLLDLVHQRAIYLDEIDCIVLDEADRMLDMGAGKDVYDILDRLPHERQSLMFSATSSKELQALGEELTQYGGNGPVKEVRLSRKKEAADTVSQWIITVDKDTRSALLSHLINEHNWDQALIFTEQKHAAAKLVEQLAKRGIMAEALHGDRSQAQRERVLKDFKTGVLKYVVATGVAARGIDIANLQRVVNYDLPFKPEEYIHRIGRTGRAGEAGEAISLVTWGDFKKLCAIESRLGHLLERRTLKEFKVRKEVPISILNYVPKSQRT